MKNILVINGPNLNLTGKRQPEIYGSMTLEDINAKLSEAAARKGAKCEFFQSNCEGALIDRIQKAMGNTDGIILNAGAYTHYSYALRDCVACCDIPVVEVHMSNIASREEFRHTSVIAPCCAGQIAGFGYKSYLLALDYLTDL